MYVIRPIRPDDLDVYEGFAYETSMGITSLPQNRNLLAEKIEHSQESFKRRLLKPRYENYLMVLEDTETGAIGGTSSIVSRTGITTPAYFYRIETAPTPKTDLPLSEERRILCPVSYTKGPSEIRGLYLDPKYRRGGLGRLLSLSRFLFVASHPRRFQKTIISEMRGFITGRETSPFWDGLGSHFLDVPLSEIFNLLQEGRDFIPAILPEHPIYVSLLPAAARAVIGKTHLHTRPALKMLEKEGFTFAEEIDLFDGGPKIAAKTAKIRTVHDSQVATIKATTDIPISSRRYLISNNRIDFRACISRLILTPSGLVVLPNDVARALRVEPGESIRFVSLHPRRSS